MCSCELLRETTDVCAVLDERVCVLETGIVDQSCFETVATTITDDDDTDACCGVEEVQRRKTHAKKKEWGRLFLETKLRKTTLTEHEQCAGVHVKEENVETTCERDVRCAEWCAQIGCGTLLFFRVCVCGRTSYGFFRSVLLRGERGNDSVALHTHTQRERDEDDI